jgi:hypothetical protein
LLVRKLKSKHWQGGQSILCFESAVERNLMFVLSELLPEKT